MLRRDQRLVGNTIGLGERPTLRLVGIEFLAQRQEVQEWRNPFGEEVFWGMGVDLLPQQSHAAGHLMANFLRVLGSE